MLKKLFQIIIVSILMLTTMTPLMPVARALGANIIANPSVEDITGTQPSNWLQDKWGTNTTTFAHKAEGHTGTKSLLVTTTKRSSGDAKWYFTPMSVKPSTSYTYSEFYKSSVATEIDIEYTDTSGKVSYVWLGGATASATNWAAKSYTFTTPANVKTMTAFHVINRVGWLQTDDFSLSETATVVASAPSVTLASPTANSIVMDTVSVAATATDAVGVSGVQFKLDGVALGAEDVTAPYAVFSWDTKASANGAHLLSATARNAGGLSTTSGSTTVTVANVVAAPTAPTVSMTSPTNNATISGASVSVAATATDAVGVSGVQFKLDGVALGAEDVTAPYATTLDSTSLTNGNHTLTATARNAASLSATSAVTTVNVQNVIVTPPTPTAGNLIANSSFELSQNGTVPDAWNSSNWGSNTTSFSYQSTGRTGSKSVKANISTYTNGAASWNYAPVAITAGKTYKYENWYQSNVDSEVDVEVLMNDGTTQWFYLTTVVTSGTWAKASGTFVAPAGSKSIAIYQILAKKGFVVSDDYALSEYTPAQYNRAMVSLTFDDGWRSIYTNGLPLLSKYGLVSTQYLLTETFDYPDYMTVAMMAAFKNQGSEIAAHTVSHANLTTLGATQLNNELLLCKNNLQSWLGVPVTNFASPYGAYNGTTLTAIKKYYRSHRSVEEGYNSKDSFDVYNIKVQNILNTTTPAQVQAWVNQAIATKTWLVLVYHEVDMAPADNTYAVTPANLDQELNIVKQSGIATLTVNQALDEINAQL